MPTKKVEKGGVYRHKDGTAVYLSEGAEVEESLLDGLSLDSGATEKRAKEAEPAFALGIQDAPQNQPAEETWSGRMVSGAPENKAAPAKTEKKGE